MSILKLFSTAVLAACSIVNAVNANTENARIRESFNEDWRFHMGNATDARFPETDDRSWRKVRLPHDWAIEGPFDIKFNARAGGLPFHGVGWYRKRFAVSESLKSKTITIEFDGAMNNSAVWINGHFLGKRPYGYVGFEYDISKHIQFGSEKKNVISVKLSPEDLSSRWYPGAGIYRNVWLNFMEPIHIQRNGTFITTPSVTADHAKIELRAEIINGLESDEQVTLKTEIFDSEDRRVASAVTPGIRLQSQLNQSTQLFEVNSPKLWDIETPELHTAVTTIWRQGKLSDRYTTRFGIRSISYDAENGFQLNGRKVAFQGVCMHHDLGPLGAAVNTRATERQLQIMKDMGANAIRTAHNPPSSEQLRLCDELGLLVQVEAFDCWEQAKVENGYNKFFGEWHDRDLREIIRRDRNNPSVIMWSIGNEILEQSSKHRGAELARHLNDICHEEDPTRPTTAGFNYYPAAVVNGLAAEIDIVGLNYKPIKYAEVLEEHPDWIIYGSETSSCVSSRGAYHLPIEKYKKHPSHEVTSYDLIGPGWAYPPDIEFHFLEQNPRALGEFIWTGFDYLGEPTSFGGRDNSTNGYWNGDWPARSSYFGAVDLCGFPKDRYYLYQSQWTDEPMVHLLPHWNWKGREGQEIPVYGYTNCEEAELFLNGKSLGRKRKGEERTRLFVDFKQYEEKTFDSKYRLSWNVPYEKGELRIVGYKNGKEASSKTIATASEPKRLSLSPDRTTIDADGYDLSFITVRVEDKSGNLCPNASNLTKFEIEGPGEIAAVGNGNPSTTEPFQSNQRNAFHGLCMLIVRSQPGQIGKITITARSKDLNTAKTVIHSKLL